MQLIYSEKKNDRTLEIYLYREKFDTEKMMIYSKRICFPHRTHSDQDLSPLNTEKKIFVTIVLIMVRKINF